MGNVLKFGPKPRLVICEVCGDSFLSTEPAPHCCRACEAAADAALDAEMEAAARAAGFASFGEWVEAEYRRSMAASDSP